MVGNGVAGIVGLVVQTAAFAIVLLASAPRQGVSRGLVNGGVVAVYGYALVVSFFLLFAVPWQVTNLLLAVGIGAVLLVPAARRAISQGIVVLLARARGARFAISIVVIVLLFQVLVTAIEPDLSIDGQLYHGPVLANILQSGSLWGWSAPNQYLYYTDLTMVGGVNLATFAGDARFDNAAQIPHLLLLMFLINWALTRRVPSAFVRVCFAALIVAAPVIWLQPRILYVDVAYGTAVAGAIFFIALVREFRSIDVVIGGILIGAVFATKPTGILSGLVLLGAICLAVFIRGHGTRSISRTIGVIAVGLGIPVVMAMSAYIRNLVQFSNPVYPVQVKLGPIVLPGILDLSVFASGDRGNGLIDASRLLSFARNIGQGMFNGVTKLDYDPRAGGFGLVPLFIVVIALLITGVQIGLQLSRDRAQLHRFVAWKAQAGIVVVAVLVLLVQPSTFDARYVIGPTVALLTAALMSTALPIPKLFTTIVGVAALLLATGQVAWTERNMYPGLNVALYLMHASPANEPSTPANPWERGTRVAWLPQDPGRCFSIALETAGGVTSSGMSETSYLGTLPYGLYGDRLCNRLAPVTLDKTADQTTNSVVRAVDYLVLYRSHVAQWEQAFPELQRCLSPVYSITGDATYREDETVFRNACSQH